MPWKMAVAAVSMRLAISECAVPEELDAEQLSGSAVAGEAHADAVASGVIGLVVVGFGLDGERLEAGGSGFVVAQARARGDLVEDLDDLCAEAAGELACAAEGVLACDASLLVRGGAEWEVGLAEESVVGDDAVSGREDVGQAWSASAGRPRSLPWRRASRRLSAASSAVRAHADDDEDEVDRAGDGRIRSRHGFDAQSPCLPGGVAAYRV